MTASAERTAGMRHHRRTVSEDKHKAVRTAVRRRIARGIAISAAAIAQEAAVTETFLYRHESVPCQICNTTFGAGPISYYRTQISRIADDRDAHAERDGRLTAASM